MNFSTYFIIINGLSFILGLLSMTRGRPVPWVIILFALAGGVPAVWALTLLTGYQAKNALFVKLLWGSTGIWLIPLILYLFNQSYP